MSGDITGHSIRHQIRATWADCDAAGIVFYPTYFRWMDDSAFQLFDSVGLGWNQLREKFGTPGTPLVDAHAQFRGPSKFDDRLDVASWVSEWGRSSFTVSHRFSRGDHVLVEGWEKRVWVSFDPDDAAKITTRPIPDEVKAAFAVD